MRVPYIIKRKIIFLLTENCFNLRLAWQPLNIKFNIAEAKLLAKYSHYNLRIGDICSIANPWYLPKCKLGQDAWQFAHPNGRSYLITSFWKINGQFAMGRAKIKETFCALTPLNQNYQPDKPPPIKCLLNIISTEFKEHNNTFFFVWVGGLTKQK